MLWLGSGYIGEWALPQKEGRSLTDVADVRSRNSQMYSFEEEMVEAISLAERGPQS
jgi:hypothetical protein